MNLPLNVNELIKQSDVQQPDMVSVQVNEEFVEGGIKEQTCQSLTAIFGFMLAVPVIQDAAKE